MPFDITTKPSQDLLERYKTSYDRTLEENNREYAEQVAEAYPLQEMNIAPSKYDEGYLFNVKDPYKSLAKQRARSQSGLAQFGSALNQAVTGEIIGGTVEGLGYLLDVEQYVNLAKGTEQEFGNWFSDLGKDLRTWTEEETPIYTDPDQDKFAPGKWSWWMNNLPSVASTLSLMIPSGAAVKGASMLAKGLNLSSKVGKGTKWAAKGITQAVVSRHMENLMEASGTYSELYNEAIQEGMSEEDAKRKASIGASSSYNMNWVMLAQDIPQYLLLSRSFSKASLDNTIATARAMGKSLTPVFGKKAAAIGWDMLTEGGEEAYQYIVGEEAKYQAQKAFDPAIQSSLSDRLSKYFQDGELWTSAFWGALGAGAMQSSFKKINDYVSGKKDPRVEDIKSWGSQFSYWNQRLKEAQESGDEIAEKYIKSNLWNTLGIKSASLGNVSNAVDFLEAMINPTEEDLEQFGVSEEDLKNFRVEIPRGIKQLRRIEELYNFNSQKYEPNRAAYITQLHAQLETGIQFQNELKAKLNSTKVNIAHYSDLWKFPYAEQYVSKHFEVKAVDDNIKFFEKQLKKKDLSERERILYTTSLEALKEEKEILDESIKEIKSNFTSGDKFILNKIDLTSPALSEYNSLLKQDKLFTEHISSLQKEIKAAESGKPISTEEEQEIYQEEKDERIKEEKQYLPTIDDLVEDEEGVYKVISENDEDDTIELHPLDENGEMIEGAQTKSVPRSSVKLYAKKGPKDAPDSNEPLNDTDIPEDKKEPLEMAKKGIKSVVSAIAYRGYDENKETGLYETVSENKELDNYVSNPSNTLEGDSISMFIDVDIVYKDPDKKGANFWESTPELKAIKETLKSGKVLTTKEANELLTRRKQVGGEEVFLMPYDKMPIGIVYKTKSGKEFKGGIYYHDTTYVEKHLTIPTKIRRDGYKNLIGPAAIKAYKNDEKIRVREARKKILYALLTGKEVVLDKITKTSGIPNNTKTKNNIADILKENPNKITLGIVDSSKSAWTADNEYIVEGFGTPGNVLFNTTKTCNGEVGSVKANLNKLSKEHAEILWDALFTKYRPKKYNQPSGNQAQFPDDRVTGLTVGEVVDLLVLEGSKATNVNHPNNKGRDMSHLVDKQLYVEKGFLHFGKDGVISLLPLYADKGNYEQDKQRFIEWVTKNKNYVIPKKPFGKKGPGLNAPIGRNFKLGNWEVSDKDTFAGVAIKYNSIVTDVQEFEDTGSVFRSPVIIIDPSSLKAMPGSTEKKTATKAKQEVKSTQSKTPKAKVKVGEKVNFRVKGENNITEEDLLNLPTGTTVYNTTTSKDVISGETEEVTKVLFIVKDNGYEVHNGGLKFALELDYSKTSPQLTEKDRIEELVDYINNQNLVQIDSLDTKEGVEKQVKESKTKPKKKETIEQEVSTPKEEVKEDVSAVNEEEYDPNMTFENEGGFGSALADLLVPSTKPIIYRKWNQDKELSWLIDKLGKDVPVEVIDGLIYIAKNGRKAFGQLKKDSILLSNVALRGTTYHEAFHRVSLLYLDDITRNKLYTEARTRYKLADATDRDVEERLAEEFRHYVIRKEQDKSIIGIIRKVFKSLYNLINIFKKKQIQESDIDFLFEQIQEGKFKYHKPTADNLKKWTDDPNLEYRDFQLDQVDTHKHFKLIIKGLSAELLSGVRETLFKEATSKYEVIGIIDSIEHIDFTKLKNNIETGQKGYYTKLARNTLYEIEQLNSKDPKQAVLEAVKKRYNSTDLKLIKDNLRKVYDDSIRIKNLYDEVLNNFETVYKPAIIDYLYSELSIKKLTESEVDEEVGNEIVRFDREAYSYAAKDNLQSSIKFLVSNLKQSNKRNPVTGLVNIAPLGEVWSRLLSNLSHLDTIEEMIKVLDVLGETNDYQPYKDLSKYLKISSELTRSQFQSTMKLHKHNFVNTIVEITEKDGQLNYEFRFMDADLQSNVNILLKEWTENFIKGDLFSQGKINGKLFSKIVEERNSLIQIYREETKGKVELSFDDYNDFLGKFTSLFNRIGININKETLALGAKEIIERGEATNKETALFKLMNEELAYIFSKHSSIQQFIDGKITDPKKVLSNEKNVDRLAELYSIINPMDLPDTILGPEGNKHYKYSLPTYVTDIVKKLKRDDNFRNSLSKDNLSRRSLLLKKDTDGNWLFDFNKLQIGTFNTIVIKDTGDEGRDYLSMSPVEDFLYKLNAVRAGYFMLPTLADRKTYPPIKGIDLPEIKYELNAEGNPVFPEWVIDIFYNYAEGERDRIESAIEAIENSKVSKEEYDILDKKSKSKLAKYQEAGKEKYIDIENLVENYHYKISGKYVIINAKNVAQRPNAIRHILFPSLEGLSKDKWREQIRKDLGQRVGDTFNEAKRLGIIGNKTNYLLNSNEVSRLENDFNGDTKLALSSIMADYEIKTQIASIETMMLFMGDIAFYKSDKETGSPFEEYVKRLSVVTSSGSLLRTRVPGEFENTQYTVTTLFDQKIVSTWYDDLYKKQKEVLLKRYDDEKYVDKLVTALLKDYKEKLNPTDAQVFISPEMHREISIRKGDWSDKKQKAYDLLQSTEKLDPEQEQELLNIVMQPLKYVYFDRLANDINDNSLLLIPTYDKMSMATLFRRFTKDTLMDKVLDRMEGVGDYEGYDKIHMVKFESAVKVGNRRRTNLLENIYTEEGDKYDPSKSTRVTDLSTLSTYKQNFEFLRHQVVTDPHDVEDTLFGSQVKKVPQANVLQDALYTTPYGESKEGREILSAINQSLGILSDKGTLKLLNKLGVDKDNNINDELFYSTLIEEAEKAGMPEQVREALRKKLPIDLLADRKWIYQRLISLTNKYGIDLKLPGNQLIQKSGFASGDVASEYRDKSNNLRFIFGKDGKINGCEAAVSVQLFRDIIPNYSNISYEDKVKWLNQNKGVLEGLGYRIPTQGQNSTIPITIAQFLPENEEDTIMLPNEFTVLTGSDFDIDKLYFVRYNYYTDKFGKAHKYEMSTEEDIDSVHKRYYDLAYEIFNDAPIINKESELKLRKLYKKKFDLIAANSHLFGEEGVRFSTLNERYQALDLMLDKAMAIENSVAFDIILKEMRSIKNRMSEMTMYEQDTKIIDSEIRDEIKTIANILEENEILPSLSDFRELPILRQQTRKALQNHLLDNYRTILLSEHNFIYTSTPLGTITDKLKRLASDITSIEESKPMWQLGAVAQARIKYKYSGGKFGVGPEALNNVHHILCQVADVSFNRNIGIGITKDGVTSLSSIDSLPEEDGQIIAISDWLSALIDAHVDIAKDPYIINLNVVSDTYNVANLLVRIGMGSKTFKFLPQPILKELVEEKVNEKGSIKEDRVEKPEDIVRKRFLDKLKKFDNYQKALDDTLGYNPFDDNLVDLIKVTEEQKDALWYAKQIRILDTFMVLDKGKFWSAGKDGKEKYFSDPTNSGAAQDLNSLVMVSRVDTKKYASDLISNELYIRALKDVYSNNKFKGLDKLLGFDPDIELSNQDKYGTFLASYFNNGPATIKKLFSDKSITGTPSFQKKVFEIANLLGIDKYTEDYKNKITKISDELYSALMGKFFTEELGITKDEVDKILSSVPAFVRDVRVKHPELIDNLLIKSLISGLETQDNMTFVGIPAIKSDDNRQDYMYAWKELITSNNKEVASFAKKLYMYAYFTSGYKQGLYSIFQYIPVSQHIDFQLNDQIVHFNDYAKNLLSTMIDYERGDLATMGLEDTIIRNNWMYSMFAPKIYNRAISDTVSFKKDKKEQTVVGTIFPMKKNPKTEKWEKNVKQIGYNKTKDPIYQPYVLYQLEKTSYLMEYIGYHNNKFKTPVYKVVGKLGYSNKGRRVVEYGFDESNIPTNSNIITLTDEKVLQLMSKKNTYKDFIYLPKEARLVQEVIELDSPQEDTTEKTYTTTEDRSLNVEAENRQESSPISQEQLDAINNKFKDMSPFNTVGVSHEVDIYTPITMEDFNNMSKEEQDNLLNCL